MKKIIVFDLDGTLVHTESYWLPILERTLDRIEEKYQMKRNLRETRDALSFLGQLDIEIYAALFPGRTQEEYLEFIELADEVWAGMVEEHPYQFYPGAVELLAELKTKGFELFLASNCPRNYLNAFLNLGLAPLVSGAACAGLYPGMKKWEFTREMLAGIGPYQGWFVGDSASDMEAGRKNGLTTVYANYGYGSQPDEGWVDVRINELGELLTVL